MSDLNNIGLIRDDDPDTFRITFDDKQSHFMASTPAAMAQFSIYQIKVRGRPEVQLT